MSNIIIEFYEMWSQIDIYFTNHDRYYYYEIPYTVISINPSLQPRRVSSDWRLL